MTSPKSMAQRLQNSRQKKLYLSAAKDYLLVLLAVQEFGATSEKNAHAHLSSSNPSVPACRCTSSFCQVHFAAPINTMAAVTSTRAILVRSAETSL